MIEDNEALIIRFQSDDPTPIKRPRYQFPRIGWELIAATVQFGLGSLLHFVYGWSGESDAVIWFTSVDESVWAHLNLVTWPFIIMTIIIWTQRSEDVWFGRGIGFVSNITLIMAVFYLYTLGNTTTNNLAADIILFAVAQYSSGIWAWLLARRWPTPSLWRFIVGILLHAVLAGLLIAFSYWKPSDSNQPFRDPDSH